MLTMPESEAVIRLWERGEREHPIDRALSILSTFTSETHDTLVATPIHRRDVMLVASRVAAFGSRIDGVAGCVACGCKIDVSFELPDFSSIALEDESLIDVDGRAVRVRVPNSGDLAEAARVGEPPSAQRLLLARCQPDGFSDETTARAVDRELERLCDASSVELKVACPGCEATFIVPVDIGGFFWAEIAAYAAGLIEDVHLLAAHYGWAEAAILAMPERRRRRYRERLL